MQAAQDMADAITKVRAVFPAPGHAAWEAPMLRLTLECGNEDVPRASDSCVPRPELRLLSPPPAIARHSFDSLMSTMKDRRLAATCQSRSPHAMSAPEPICRPASADTVPPHDFSDTYLVPPTLNYTLRDKKLRIALFWCFILLDCAIVPAGLYFILWYDAGPGSQESHPLSANTVLSIVTATIGGTAILEFALSIWKLFKKSSDCRVIGAQGRWVFDWFHWWFGLCLIIVIAEVILGTAWKMPNRRLLALPLSSLLVVLGTVLLVTDILHFFSVRAPVRISSIPRGALVPPGVYPFVEDICAVSGNGKTEFRLALDRRYQASPAFRDMLRQVSMFWALGALAAAGGTAYLVLCYDDIDLAFLFGWTVPYVWAGVWIIITIPWVQHMLKREQRLWAQATMEMNVLA